MTIPVFAVIGALVALPARALSQKLIRDRQGEPCVSRMLCGTHSAAGWAVISMLGWALIAAANREAGMVRLIQFVCVFELMLCLSAVDILIRRIPNELLLALLSVFVIGGIAGGTLQFKSNLLGALIAAAAFTLPSKMGVNIGWGDVKYAAVIGFGLGLIGFLQVTAVMAITLGIYTVYLYVTRRGSIKSFAAIGPYLSLGAVSALVFPVLQTIL